MPDRVRRARSLREAVPSGLVLITFRSDTPGISAARVRRAYLTAHVFELLLAIVGVISSINFLADPSALSLTPIGQALHPFDTFWTVGYGVSGFGVVWGLACPSPRVEALSLYVFSAAILGNVVAILSLRGSVGLGAALTYLAVVGAFAIRIRTIHDAIGALNHAVATIRGRE